MRWNAGAIVSWSVLVALMVIGTACNRSETGDHADGKTDGEKAAVKQTGHVAGLDDKHGAAHADHESPIDAHNETDGLTQAPAATTPAEAVTNFLDAVRRGDDGQAEALLTELARKKTREMDLAVAPPGSPTAKFEVGTTEYPYEGSESAHVASQWSDIDGSGYERTDEIVWILRKEPDGWRIGGMATKLFDDQPPLILNFEDPQDMVKKQQAAEAEIERRDQAKRAQRPSDPATIRE